MLRNQLADAISARQKKYGDDFMHRMKQGCFKPLSPGLHNTTMFIPNARRFIKPKLIDGTPNPLWPEGVEAPPRDADECKKFFDELTEKHLQSWLDRIEAGEFDRAPEVEASSDEPSEERLSADDLEDQPETEVVSADDFEEEVGELLEKHAEKKKEKEKEERKKEVIPEGASQEKLDAVAQASKKRIEDPNEPHPVIRLREAIEDIARGAIDVRAFGNVQEMIDLVQSFNAEIMDLKKRCDAQKKYIQMHHADIAELKADLAELKQPKKSGGLDDL
jgi:hypothetical protein